MTRRTFEDRRWCNCARRYRRGKLQQVVLRDFDEMRAFAVKSAIVTVMDGLDQYLRVTNRVAGLVPAALHDDLNGRREPKIERRRTVAERLRVLASSFRAQLTDESCSS